MSAFHDDCVYSYITDSQDSNGKYLSEVFLSLWPIDGLAVLETLCKPGREPLGPSVRRRSRSSGAADSLLSSRNGARFDAEVS